MPQDANAIRSILSLAPVVPVIILDDVAQARPLADLAATLTQRLADYQGVLAQRDDITLVAVSLDRHSFNSRSSA